MKLNRRFVGRNTADGTYRVQCEGAQRVRLAWDAKDDALEAYLDFAYLPLSPPADAQDAADCACTSPVPDERPAHDAKALPAS